MKIENLILASDAEVADVISKARAWVNSHGGWSSTTTAAATAVMEYELNKQGKTAYRHKQGKSVNV